MALKLRTSSESSSWPGGTYTASVRPAVASSSVALVRRVSGLAMRRDSRCPSPRPRSTKTGTSTRSSSSPTGRESSSIGSRSSSPSRATSRTPSRNVAVSTAAITARNIDRLRLMRGPSAQPQPVAAGHGADDVAGELLAELAHVDADHARAGAGLGEEPLLQLLGGEDPLGVVGEELEHLELPRREPHLLVLPGDAPVREVHVQGGPGQHRAAGLGAAAQQRPHARQELGQAEGLHEVVVATEVEAPHAVG